MNKWKSEVYEHYIMPPTIVVVDGKIRYKFVCKTKPSIFVTHAHHDNSTSNLVWHITECDPIKSTAVSLMRNFVHSVSYDKAKFWFLLVMWLVHRHRPYVIIEDPEFKQLLLMLYGKVDIPPLKRWEIS
ncbi:hypothetical protein BD410DRAFT_719575 [Rickenella mellea]|uniref:Uncharacterized protein n=1 Tax=Rickenella mellea TaxID=50990 RepID=A0A4Y7Q944_9AGAM|nr:hypothetical protein BD410DRAFT_719575 [Rickenella mellea]